MKFISTRAQHRASATAAILRGLAEDGGLYVPEVFPQVPLSRVSQMAQETYIERAQYILGLYLDEDYSEETMRDIVAKAYAADSFDHPAVAPLSTLAPDLYALELYHGSTLAFKDMALQLLPHLIVHAAKREGETRTISILVATSGDTGKAALEGFLDVNGTTCTVFYPHQGVSRAQYLQMATTAGDNTHVIAVRGNFDDTQTGVKRIFGDAEMARELSDAGYVLSSANSINLGRLLPQIVYYFSAYADLIASKAIALGDTVNFCVPTGNFGNILAGYYAQRMGLPIGKLICATNRNDVLNHFILSGVYDANRAFYQTMSPSMDILISSNLERLLYELAGRDGATVATWMRALGTANRYEMDAEKLSALNELFVSGTADEAQTLAQIAHVYQDYGYLIDPHTAVASHVLDAYRAVTGDNAPAVLVSTASPYKFAPAVAHALTGQVSSEGDLALCRSLAQETGAPLPKQIEMLADLPIRHTTVCDIEQMPKALYQSLDI